MPPVSVRAIQLIQHSHRIYLASIPIDSLFDSVFVVRRDDDPVAGFQRALAVNRADDIANYLTTGSIPTSVVLSAQRIADLKWDAKAGSISFAPVPKAFFVLDGQHRIWGFQRSTTRLRVPVAIYSGLSRAQEAKLFIDINTKQKGVPAALLLDIKQVAEIESQKEQLLRRLFDRLQTDSRSPLAGKLVASKSQVGKISRVTFNRAVGIATESDLMEHAEEENKYRLILNYLNAFDAELDDKHLLVRSAYFEAIFDVFGEIIRNAKTRYKDYKKESIQNVVRHVAKIELISGVGRTLPSKKEIVKAMESVLRQDELLTEDLL